MVSIAKQGQPVGRVLGGRYRIEGVLGRGAMGSVYKAVDEESHRVCAIKLMHQFATLDDRAYLRFIHEAQIVAQLYHPNIVEVWGFDRDEDGTPILAMELLQGQDLHSQISDGNRVPLARVLEIVRAVGGALHAAHSAGVLHRDIKPKNIFLSLQKNSRGEEVETVKVVDFGLSKVLGMQHANETAPGTILGTAEYVAPESTLGMPELIDFRVDQWALGVVAYRLLTGRLPFEAPDVITLLLSIRTTRPPPLRELLRGQPEKVPEHVIAAVERSMSKSKEDRFDTVQDFLRALDGLPTIGHVLSKSSDGVPAINPAEWGKRNLAGQSLTDLGRISISGAMQAPPSATSARGGSSPSGKLAASALSGRAAASATSGRPEDSMPSGRVSPRATAIGLGPVPANDLSSHTDVGAGQAPSRRTPKYGLLNAAGQKAAAEEAPAPSKAAPVSEAETAGTFAPMPASSKNSEPSKSAKKPVEGSAEYSMHMSGHLVNGSGAQPNPDAAQPPARRSSNKLLLPGIAVAFLAIGVIWFSTSRRTPPSNSTTVPQAPPTTLVTPSIPATVGTLAPPATTASPAIPAPPQAPIVASPTGVAPPPVAPSPAVAPPPVAEHNPLAPVAGVPGRPGGPTGARPQPGQWGKGARPGVAWRPAAKGAVGIRRPGAPGAAPGQAAAQPGAQAGVDFKPVDVAKNPPPAVAPPPATPPSPPPAAEKASDAPRRITVVD